MKTLFDIYESTKTFAEYDKENPAIWQAFVRIAFHLINSGVKHSGGKAIAEILRDGDFKINNSFISSYTRKFAKEYPEHKDFFEFRNKGEYMFVNLDELKIAISNFEDYIVDMMFTAGFSCTGKQHNNDTEITTLEFYKSGLPKITISFDEKEFLNDNEQ